MTEDRPALLCLIEDDPIMGQSLCDRFELEGFDVDWHRTATAAEQGLRQVQKFSWQQAAQQVLEILEQKV